MMATGRTVNKFSRIYVDGYDLSGYVRQIGEINTEFEHEPMAALTDQVKNALVGQVNFGVGDINAFLDNTATLGLHAMASGNAGTKRAVMIPIGIRADPAQGDPVFVGEFDQIAYKSVPEKGFVTANLKLGQMDATAAALAYSKAWGVLLAAKTARTAVNTAIGIDDNGGQSALGGYLAYQLFTSNGTVTLKVQDAATNLDASFADISGATSGLINASVTPVAGVVALARNATVRQFLRWQLVFGTATSATFALAFVRATF
jgi:hypothetical protein